MTSKKIALLSIMLATMLVLTSIESMIAPLPFYAKPGLANVVVMFCVFSIGRSQAVLLNVLKSVFVLIIRGPIAGLLSLSGGLLSIVVVILLKKTKMSYSAISVLAACVHNLGQLLAASVLLSTFHVFYYTPVLIISSIVMGFLTGTLLRILIPLIGRN